LRIKFREKAKHGMEFKKLAENNLMMPLFGCFMLLLGA
jgi:hypothetical protein